VTTQRGTLIEVVMLDTEAKKILVVDEPWWTRFVLSSVDSGEYYFGSSIWIFNLLMVRSTEV
jgi:hypothetical protein